MTSGDADSFGATPVRFAGASPETGERPGPADGVTAPGSSSPTAWKIPRILHFSVPDPMSALQAAVIEQARSLHPDWEIKVWHDDGIPGGRFGKYLARAHSGAGLADLIRLDALFSHGGVYLDSDIRVLRPFEELVERYDFFIGAEDGYNLTNALIGAAPQHPALDAVIAFLEENEPDWSLPPNVTTGPVLFAKLLRWRPDVNILPRKTFYPYNWNEEQKPPHRLSYAVHMWDISWRDKARPTGTLARRYAAAAGTLVKGALRPGLAAGLTQLRRIRAAAERGARGVATVSAPGSYACGDEIVANTVHGQKIVLDGHDLGTTPEVALRGWFELPEESFVCRTLRGGDWFLDVGASVGVFTILAAGLCGPLGRVWAFEPDLRLRRLLTKSVMMNRYHDRIKIVRAALGEEDGTALLSGHRHRPGDPQITGDELQPQPIRVTGQFPEQAEVAARRLDDVIPVDLPIKILRIGAKGHEAKILSGARRLLASRAFDFILLKAPEELFTRGWKEMAASLRGLIDTGYHVATLDREGLLVRHASLDAALRSRGASKTLVFSAA